MVKSYLCRVTEEAVVFSEADAAALIAEAKADSRFQVLKSSTEYKTIKEKKEIVDEYWVVKITKLFNDPKCPETHIEVIYNVEDGFFPSPVNHDSEADD